MKVEEAVEVLGRTPGVLRALLGGIPDAWSTHEPDPGWWSARDVLGHLIHGERTDWVHPSLGPVSLGQLIATWAVHDLNHLGQITEAMAKRYRDEIGPWRAYLPIVNREMEDSG